MNSISKYLIFLLLLSACVDFDGNSTSQDKAQSVDIIFGVDTPQMSSITTRSVDEDYIETLYLLLFDENNQFLSRHEASLIEQGSYRVTLDQSDQSRVIHFVANYSWDEFDDAEQQGGGEAEVMTSLVSDNLTFWQRSELPSGISSGSLSGGVSLVRNQAKFTLDDQSESTLSDIQFALYNVASSGTVAPFNTSTSEFEMVVTEPAGVSFTESTTFTSSPIYSFERDMSLAGISHSYIIVEGNYQGEVCYYKVDIVSSSGEEYDILRNYCYNIIVGRVDKRGYLTLVEAQNSPASNNIEASVELQSYPLISDGSYILSVDNTQVSFTSNGERLNILVSYQSVDGELRNDLVEVTLIQDESSPVVVGNISFDPDSGAISGEIDDVPSDGAIYRAQIKITAGNLSRTVTLLLHASFKFESIELSSSVVSNQALSPVTLYFTIPDDAEYLLPFDCYITTSHLSPQQSLDMVGSSGGYQYLWGVSSVGVQSIDWFTNRSDAAETIYIDALLFESGWVSYTNEAEIYSFSNVSISPSRIPFNQGESVTLRFTTPTAGLFYIATSKLTPVDGTSSRGVYSYYTDQAGEQVVEFTTADRNVYETITLSADRYNDYSLELKNELVNLSGTVSYGNRNSNPLRNSTLYLLIDSQVVAILTTDSSGGYQASIEAEMGDILTFEYYLNTNYTYSDSVVITSSTMEVDPDLSR